VISRNVSNHVDRGWYRYMQYINALIGCTFIVLALLHAPHPNPFTWLPYSIAAVLALITIKAEISIPISRILAIATTALMFFFFAGFFLMVPKLAADWYTHQAGWEAVSRILGAFVMIPILSDYSCRLKADCIEARRKEGRAFFSVPNHITNNDAASRQPSPSRH
jgi:energy-coupling factor transporter transmembrane protein EcfT